MSQQIEGDKQEVPVAAAAAAGLAAGSPVADHSLPPAELGSLAAAGHMLRAGSSYSGCS